MTDQKTTLESTHSNQENIFQSKNNSQSGLPGPSTAFVAASWVALVAGISSFIISLWNAQMELNEKGYYFTILLFGLFSAISLQKAVRDRQEGIPVTDMYYGLSWACCIISIVLLIIGLRNASLDLSEKGFYGMSFLLGLFSVIAIQKNTRDSLILKKLEEV